ncbi:MAG: hypothetical protein GF411_08465 [Candidatus Lokiarchaeota archaeon]|nr:hypothetical protein [Candidatus Lokiarchaeota archaeon]
MRLLDLYSEPIDILLESKNSTIMLDFDETLAHVAGTVEEKGSHLTFLMEEQADDLSGLEAVRVPFDRGRFTEAYNNYKYKQNVLFTELSTRKAKGTSIILLRPHLCKFLTTMQSLPPEKARNIVVFTGNIEGEKLIGMMNKACGTKIPPHQKSQIYHPDSLVLDDDTNMAFIKLFSTKVEISKPGSKLNRWVRIPKFLGNFNDNELLVAAQKINRML